MPVLAPVASRYAAALLAWAFGLRPSAAAWAFGLLAWAFGRGCGSPAGRSIRCGRSWASIR